MAPAPLIVGFAIADDAPASMPTATTRTMPARTGHHLATLLMLLSPFTCFRAPGARIPCYPADSRQRV